MTDPTVTTRATRTEAEVDALIEEWHNAGPGARAGRVELHEWLGMTWDEYRAWAGPERKTGSGG